MQVPVSFVFCFLASVFLGYFVTLLCPSFSMEPSLFPSLPPRGSTNVKEGLGHVMVRGRYLGAASLATHGSRNPWEELLYLL